MIAHSGYMMIYCLVTMLYNSSISVHPISYLGYRFAARAKNRGWRIDYFILSDSLKSRLVDMYVGSEINQDGKRRSDHAPIWLHLAPPS